MKNIILLFISQYLLYSCFFTTDPFRYYKQEYNPQKAGAEIAARIILPSKPHYVSYANSQCYILNDNNISVYDLTNDRLSLDYHISFNISSAYHDESGDYRYSINECSGIIVMQNKISCVLSVLKQNKRNSDEKIYFWEVLSVEYDVQADKWSDVTSDKSNFPIENLDYNQAYWYDNSGDILYAGSYGRTAKDNLFIRQFRYNSEIQDYAYIDSLELIFEQSSRAANSYIALYLLHNIFLVRICERHGNGESDSYLSFYPQYQTNRTKRIHLNYLRIFNESYSAFHYDNGNIWLYHHGYDENKKQAKYELLKLKLL